MSLATDILRRAAQGMPMVSGMFGDYDATTWQPEDDARLLDLRARGLVYKQIARLVGKTESACASRHSRLMLQQNKLDNAVHSVNMGSQGDNRLN